MSNATEERALALLGKGFNPEIVASSVGISVSRISQLLSDANFASQVSELRFKNLSKHSDRDEKYDKIEDVLIKRMEDCLPLMFKPMEVLRALTQINAVKRKGVSDPSSITNQQEVVQLILPTAIINSFTMNIHNQVVKVGEKNLITIQSGNMENLLQKSKDPNAREVPNVEYVNSEESRISDAKSRLRAARERTSAGTFAPNSTNVE